MTVEQLKRAVRGLSPTELNDFANWFDTFLSAKWDQQIERDILEGRLDKAGTRADEDFDAGRCTPL